MINSYTPLDVIISNQKFLIVPNKTAFYCYLAFTVQLFSFHFFFFWVMLYYITHFFSLKFNTMVQFPIQTFPFLVDELGI